MGNDDGRWDDVLSESRFTGNLDFSLGGLKPSV